jgi:hypothetical protein
MRSHRFLFTTLGLALFRLQTRQGSLAHVCASHSRRPSPVWLIALLWAARAVWRLRHRINGRSPVEPPPPPQAADHGPVPPVPLHPGDIRAEGFAVTALPQPEGRCMRLCGHLDLEALPDLQLGLDTLVRRGLPVRWEIGIDCPQAPWVAVALCLQTGGSQSPADASGAGDVERVLLPPPGLGGLNWAQGIIDRFEPGGARVLNAGAAVMRVPS